MEALPLRTGRTNCVTNMQQDMVEQTLAIIASMMQQAAHDATLYCAEARRTVILIRTTISPDTDGSNSCHERTMHGNSLRLSGYASLALIRHWTIFLLLVHQ